MDFYRQAKAVYDELRHGSGLWRLAQFKDSNGGYSGYKCPKCDGTLEYTYLENAIYAMRCDGCASIQLISARNPEQAANQVGLWFGKVR